MKSYEARFWSKVDRLSDAECWAWQAYIMPSGYGRFMAQKTVCKYAHRIAFELSVGEIPPGYVIDHLCRNRACVNPAHLEAVTNRENILRGYGFSAKNARKTTCPHGHALDGIRPANGRRYCRECSRIANRAAYVRRCAVTA